jgi:hypothetical protein
MLKLFGKSPNVMWIILIIVLSVFISGASLRRLFGFQPPTNAKAPVPYAVTLQETFYNQDCSSKPNGSQTWAAIRWIYDVSSGIDEPDPANDRSGFL